MANASSKDDRKAADSLNGLLVISRLDVGPYRVEPNRVTAPYRVTKNGQEDAIDLIYRFEEEVFDPEDPASQNLAGMLAAQVALNYGLFCEKIVFHGLFDAHDRRFIHEMARNTSREIFVKKFLEPNPFILEPFTTLPPVKRTTYQQARLLFQEEEMPTSPAGWRPVPNRCAVLSSGGKDSLLSFGLMRELGHETHPIFINESGRH